LDDFDSPDGRTGSLTAQSDARSKSEAMTVPFFVDCNVMLNNQLSSIYHAILILWVCTLVSPFSANAVDLSIEKELQHDLEESRSIIVRANEKLSDSKPISTELVQLKTIAENRH
jgi:hypothetical protein